MECPQCNQEMESLEGDDVSVTRCSNCGGVWIDASDLNRVLLHHNLPGMESLGGRANLDEVAGQCPVDLADLVVVEGPGKPPMRYDACEVCGGIWLEDQRFDGEGVGPLLEQIVDFYREFAR